MSFGHIAFVALGSNVGNRQDHLELALHRLDHVAGIRVVRAADAIETEPVDCPPGSDAFLNSVAEIETKLLPHALLEQLHAIEQQMGRFRMHRNAPRTIDLDLILFDQQIIREPNLILPHARMHERRFVLEPLAQIAPDFMHPVFGKSIRELLEILNG